VTQNDTQLPSGRLTWSFGQLLDWHLFKHGTRPHVQPSAKAGRTWNKKEAARALEITSRTLSYWLTDQYLPRDTKQLEKTLFGDSAAYDDWRVELRKALEKTRASKGSGKSDSGAAARTETSNPQPKQLRPEPADAPPPPARTINLPVLFGAERPKVAPEPPDARVSGQTGAGPASEKPGNDRKIPAKIPAITGASESRRSPGASGQSSRKNLYFVSAGFAVLAVAYGAIQFTSGTRQGPGPDPRPGPVVQKPTPPETSTQQPTKSDARREREARQEEQQKQSDAEIQRAVDEDIRRDALTSFKLRDNFTVNGQTIGGVITLTEADCAVACMRSRCDGWAFNKNGPFVRGTYRACLRFAAPLTFTANPDFVAGQRIPEADAPRTTGNATVKPEVVVVKSEAAPITVAEAPVEKDRVHCAGRYFVMPGFKLTCNQMLTGGTSPGPGPTSFIVGTANDCMAKCKPVENCVGFTYDVAEKSVQHICRIFGPTPNTVTSAGWLRAVR